MENLRICLWSFRKNSERFAFQKLTFMLHLCLPLIYSYLYRALKIRDLISLCPPSQKQKVETDLVTYWKHTEIALKSFFAKEKLPEKSGARLGGNPITA